ncbi:ribonucleoside-diphosphate reductase, adenosylcobalamin-dependent [Clostridium thermosuccinogenes]|uniref:Vitamin B12-dependent ribonucleotide reductase n=1 Tax=Clostridium thermosuccinogenes TaxID=84032 RepID=A0A2K2FDF6_9CLOT|nr:vitamin B12-dependent ribonucleotide reductase [Pseudoclostridium thermosuccinogenes]AUS96402.1 ribonucleoside-diphosphate reductase, adenosylcobalamin-dependent [Pseudoclostridium thermosuccinogenes]PNT95625.1 ribonucleoside-diphosphate reductase, adenosylcobalamin-dependent [Pseudoclostridium thermosuccinogenes]PNT96821.1 ribonucleoside-diphosphate reductase, adenosylcobalamin-dependent [Pseudoclostridium thermosuccinogenes]
MSLTENAIKVLEKRYLAKDEEGRLLENPEGMFRRVAKAVAAADVKYVSAPELKKIEQEFFEMMANLEFLPNSPTLMNAGRPLGQLSACFVLPIEDTMEGIFETIKNAALIHKSGGGTGFSFSRLRPRGAAVNSTGGVASGPVSFMRVFNAATEAVKQGGTRRGANMGILRVDHPDILEFITSKRDNADITNFNISVGITEDFMEAVEKGWDYELIDPHTKKVTGTKNAREVFDLIVDMAWNNGEPGIVFLDRLNKANVTPELGEIESTNPCGEQPLLPYEACNLGSINLSLMLKENGNVVDVDFDKLRKTVIKAVHFLDNVIDVNKYPLPEIDEMTRGTRKIGLGVMGWADMLCKMRIPYNSQKAINLAEKVMKFIQEESRKASIEIAERKGVFPYYDKSIYKEMGIRVRNATTTTIAPTGTLSIIAGVSSGIEPLFAISYIRNVMDNDELVEVNPLFKQIAEKEGFYSEELMRRIAKKGSISGFAEIPKYIRDVFVTSHDISPEGHVKMQAAFQKYTDNAVSKTVNLRHEATKEDVREVFILADKLNCKGVTIYRDGSRDSQVLNIGKVNNSKADETKQETKPVTHIEPRPRPNITTGFTEKVKIGCGNLYITVNYDEDGICEVFTNTGRAGGCPSQSEATARLVSIALRSGIKTKTIVEQLKGIRCPSTIRQKGLNVLSCPDAIGRLIEKVAKLQNGTDEEVAGELSSTGILNVPRPTANCDTSACSTCTMQDSCNNPDRNDAEVINACPECGRPVEHEGGCVVCRNCGYSKCG